MRPTPSPRSRPVLRAALICATATALLASAPAAGIAAPTITPQQADMASMRAMSKFATLPGPSLAQAATDAVNQASRNESRARANLAQVTSGTCVAQIVAKRGKTYRLVTLKVSTYKYKYVRKKGGGFKRVIVKVKVSVKRSCAAGACVQARKLRGTYRPIYDVRLAKTKVVKKGRIVTAKRRKRVYRFGDCASLPDPELFGTKVKVDILPGSYALLDFDQFQRQAVIQGTLGGFIPGKFVLNSDYKINLTTANLSVAQTNVFIDDECGGTPTATVRTGSPFTVKLLGNTSNSKADNFSTFLRNGTVTALTQLRIRMPLELRNGETGCTQRYISTGYAEYDHRFFFSGKLGVKKLAALQLNSSKEIIVVYACLQRGLPTQPCQNDIFIVPLPILISTQVIAKVNILD
jgi:hypothetical protein